MTPAEVAAQMRRYQEDADAHGGAIMISAERLDLWAAALEEEGK